jgi:hypothetical protein
MKLLTLLAAVALSGLFLAPAAISGGNSIAINPAYGPPVSSAAGVAFDVSTGGGNRDFASVEVICRDGAGTVVYDTVLTVEVPAKGTGTSQVIYPTANTTCVANLEKQMQIGKARVLATTGDFAVGP